MPDPAVQQQVAESYVGIDKYDCPTGTDWSIVSDYALLTAPGACVPNQTPVFISVNNEARQITSSGEWGPYESATSYQISEQVPQGYNLPHIFCGGYIPGSTQPSLNYFGAASAVVPQINPGESLYYAIFNHQEAEQTGTVAVYKWERAPGTEYGQTLEYYQSGLPDQEVGPCETEHLNVPISLIDANGPRATTTEANGTEWNNVVPDQNGSFQIGEEIPAGYGEPMVFCGTLDEETQQLVTAAGGSIPSDIDYVFVLDCTSTDIPKVHQYPLSWGNRLDVNVAGGDSIVCNWYNVPNPENGWATVYKYQCWTSTFISEVDCEIYEFGATFEFFSVPGETSYGVGTTNEGGLYT